MVLTVPRYTLNDLERFPDDGQRYELLDGMLLVTPQAGENHQLVATRLALVLSQHLSGMARVRVVGPGAVVLEPATQLQPDVLVYRPVGPAGDNWRSPRELWLAVEVLSGSSRIYDREFKRDAYLALEVREVWLVDLQERAVYVSRADGTGEERHAAALRWSPPDIDQPLELNLSRMFVDLE